MGLYFRTYVDVREYKKEDAGKLVDFLHKKWNYDTVTSTQSEGAKHIPAEFQQVSIRGIVDAPAIHGFEHKAHAIARSIWKQLKYRCRVEVQFAFEEDTPLTFTLGDTKKKQNSE
jgi:hypothetical protein